MRYCFVGEVGEELKQYIDHGLNDTVFLPPQAHRMEVVKKAVPSKSGSPQWDQAVVVTFPDAQGLAKDMDMVAKKKGMTHHHVTALPDDELVSYHREQGYDFPIESWIAGEDFPPQPQDDNPFGDEMDLFGDDEGDFFSDDSDDEEDLSTTVEPQQDESTDVFPDMSEQTSDEGEFGSDFAAPELPTPLDEGGDSWDMGEDSPSTPEQISEPEPAQDSSDFGSLDSWDMEESAPKETSKGKDIVVTPVEFKGDIAQHESLLKKEQSRPSGDSGEEVDAPHSASEIVRERDDFDDDDESLGGLGMDYDDVVLKPSTFQTDSNPDAAQRVRDTHAKEHWQDPSQPVRMDPEEDDPPYMKTLSETDRVEQKVRVSQSHYAGTYAKRINEHSRLYYVTGTSGGVGKTTYSYAAAELMAKALTHLRNRGVTTRHNSQKVFLIEFDWTNPKLQDVMNTNSSIWNLVEEVELAGSINNNMIRENLDACTLHTSDGLNIIPAPMDPGLSTEHMMSLIMCILGVVGYLLNEPSGTIIFIDAPTLDPIRKDQLASNFFRRFSPEVLLVTDIKSFDLVVKAHGLLTPPIDGRSTSLNGRSRKVFGYGMAPEDIKVIINKIPVSNQTHTKELKERLNRFRQSFSIAGAIPLVDELDFAFVSNISKGSSSANALYRSVLQSLANIGFTSMRSLLGDSRQEERKNTKPAGFFTRFLRRRG